MGHKPGLNPLCSLDLLSAEILTTHYNISNPGKANQRLCRSAVEGETGRGGEGEDASRR